MPGLPPANPESEITKRKRYIIVAGLELGGSKQPSPLKLNVLSLFMGTMLGEQQEIEEHKFHAVKITDMFSVGKNKFFLFRVLLTPFQRPRLRSTTLEE